MAVTVDIGPYGLVTTDVYPRGYLSSTLRVPRCPVSPSDAALTATNRAPRPRLQEVAVAEDRTRDGAPHPEHSMAERLARFQGQHPDIMIWGPTTSATGSWEAMGDGWTLNDDNPSRLLDRIDALIHADNPETPATDQPKEETSC